MQEEPTKAARHPRDASLEWVAQAIFDESPNTLAPQALAEVLVSIAEKSGVPIEQLVEWIHTARHAKHSDLTPGQFWYWTQAERIVGRRRP
ncbi:MAG: hypothetical protein ACRD4O_10360 [Bryobacteraceae bacterium]